MQHTNSIFGKTFLLWLSTLACSCMYATGLAKGNSDSLYVKKQSKIAPAASSPLIYIGKGTVVYGLEKINIRNEKEKDQPQSKSKEKPKKKPKKKEVKEIKIRKIKPLATIQSSSSDTYFSNNASHSAAFISAPSYNQVLGLVKNLLIVILFKFKKNNKVASASSRAILSLSKSVFKVRPPPILNFL
ncbi:hypothetical protein [Chryseobacterium sp. CT-SW4]|uniref:hypothetical protein n=1 Tax=Chryseobacterium sp. SW-1 TaxID=3157343 RepID=UPI003B01A231